MAKTLEGKVAVVTGASSGIGKSIVEKYAEAGALVVAFARNLDALKALEASYPGQVKAVAGDVTKPEDLKRLVDEAVRAHGGASDETEDPLDGPLFEGIDRDKLSADLDASLEADKAFAELLS